MSASELKTPREKAEEIAIEIWSAYECDQGDRHEGQISRLKNHIADTLTPLIEEIEALKWQVKRWEDKEVNRASCCVAHEEEVIAARTLRDASNLSEWELQEANMKPLHEYMESYDAIRKRNEGK